MEDDFLKLKREFETQKKDLAETKRILKELKKENQQKDRECHEACKSLKELQNELMRKSMHVGSLGMHLPFHSSCHSALEAWTKYNM